MIKVFTLNKNGKIELTEKELKKLLDDAYWEGYRDNTHTWTYTTPNWQPYTWYSTTCASSGNAATSKTITLTSSNAATGGTVTLNNYTTETTASNII